MGGAAASRRSVRDGLRSSLRIHRRDGGDRAVPPKSSRSVGIAATDLAVAQAAPRARAPRGSHVRPWLSDPGLARARPVPRDRLATDPRGRHAYYASESCTSGSRRAGDADRPVITVPIAARLRDAPAAVPRPSHLLSVRAAVGPVAGVTVACVSASGNALCRSLARPITDNTNAATSAAEIRFMTQQRARWSRSRAPWSAWLPIRFTTTSRPADQSVPPSSLSAVALPPGS
jgi:hypothetical protein